MFTKAIVRRPGRSFAQGLTSARLGPPSLEKALQQHEAYCQALKLCGLEVTRLEADERHPDSTFVEDVAVLTPRGAILTRPGAPSRQGEVAGIRQALAAHFKTLRAIVAPGTLDGGDVCQAEDRYFIGVSERTNEEGARQLAALLRKDGFTATLVDIRKTEGILHLKSGIAWLGEDRLAVIGALSGREALEGYEAVPVAAGEQYAANCVRVNDRIIVAAGYPKFLAALKAREYAVLALDVSEFRKMDGGLSCLSLRF
jgi:dimethylargininase